jgi:hypothetical protein
MLLYRPTTQYDAGFSCYSKTGYKNDDLKNSSKPLPPLMT